MAEGGEKVAVITGASAGIGLETAKALAARGFRIIAHGRTPANAAAALAQIRAAAPPGARIDMVLADLSEMAQAKRAADEIAALSDRIDVLVNNAGAVIIKREVTWDGYERQFAGNHLGPMLLTQRLLPRLRAAGPGARIIFTSSVAQMAVKQFPWDDLQHAKSYPVQQVYGMTKLANMMTVHELAKRLAGDGIDVFAVHPGVVASEFWRANWMTRAMAVVGRPFMKSNAQGADTIVWLATAPRGTARSGGYFTRRKEATPNPIGVDDAQTRRLWDESERLIAATGV